MTDKVFGQVYADQYDLLYGDKDYEAECDLIENVFRKYGNGKIKTILDLGCGTGNHAIPMARRGYQVTGVDISEDMLTHARAKSQSARSEGQSFLHGDVRRINLHQQFDAVLMMFAVLGYQKTNEDILAALNTANHHIKPGGLLICDVWYGPAVLAIRPKDCIKIIPSGDAKIIRVASTQLDVRKQLCRIQYHLWNLASDRVLTETDETHEMRYFFPMEVEFLLKQTNFSIQSLTAFPTLDRPTDETTWNVLIVSKTENG
jgi:SAM-dependent methyltransferase